MFISVCSFQGKHGMAVAAEPGPPCRSCGAKLCFPPTVQTPPQQELCHRVIYSQPILFCCAVNTPVHLQKTQTWSSPSPSHRDKPGQEMGAVCPVVLSKVTDAGRDLVSSTDLIRALFLLILQWNYCPEGADGMHSIAPGLAQVLLFLPCHTADWWIHWKNNPRVPQAGSSSCAYITHREGWEMGSGRESHWWGVRWPWQGALLVTTEAVLR